MSPRQYRWAMYLVGLLTGLMLGLAVSSAHGASLSGASRVTGQTLQKRTPPLAALSNCHWELHATGGQTPGSTIVLHLTNVCDNGGPQRTIRVWVAGSWTCTVSEVALPTGSTAGAPTPLPDLQVAECVWHPAHWHVAHVAAPRAGRSAS